MDGIYLLSKEIRDTSMFVVNKAKAVLKLKKAGHTGTLDPFASGLIIVCANQATKTAQVFQNLSKIYEAVFVFGEEKDTDDLTGKTIATSAIIPNLEDIKSVLPLFMGKIDQVPPEYSAVWVDGVRAFNLKRSGQEVELKAKKIEVFEFEILDYWDNELRVRINCSSGSYIRAIARDLGRILKSYAYVKALKRLTIGEYTLNQAKLISEISVNDFIPLQKALEFLPAHILKPEFEVNVCNAVPIREEFFSNQPPDLTKDEFYVVLTSKNKLLAVLKGGKYYYIDKEAL